MIENKIITTFSLSAVLISAGVMGFSILSVINIQNQLNQALDGDDLSSEIMVAIIDPDQGEIVSGTISIRVIVYGIKNYNVTFLRNTTSTIGSALQISWDSSSVADGWWNITCIITDIRSSVNYSDEVIVLVQNSPQGGIVTEPMGVITVVHDSSRDEVSIPWSLSYIASNIGETYIWSDKGPELKDTTYCIQGSHGSHRFIDSSSIKGKYIIILESSFRIIFEWEGWNGELRNDADTLIDFGVGKVYGTLYFTAGEWHISHMAGTVGNTNFECY